MITHDCIQGSEIWNDLRLGIPTASDFHRILTRGGKKGPQPSSQQWGYLMELLAERRLGVKVDSPKTSWMNRGNELEGEALSYYHLMTDNDTEQVGFVTNDAGTFGASPDRIVIPSRKRGLELKCPSPGQHMSYVLMEGDLADEYFIQTQGQMLVCEFDGVDLVSYFPGLPTAMHQTERDAVYIAALDEELKRFCDRLAELELKVNQIAGTPASDTKERVTQDSLMSELRASLIEVNRG